MVIENYSLCEWQTTANLPQHACAKRLGKPNGKSPELRKLKRLASMIDAGDADKRLAFS